MLSFLMPHPGAFHNFLMMKLLLYWLLCITTISPIKGYCSFNEHALEKIIKVQAVQSDGSEITSLGRRFKKACSW